MLQSTAPFAAAALALVGALAVRVPRTVLVGAVPGEFRGERARSPPLALQDDLHWLRDASRSDPAVLAHLALENVYTRAACAPQAALRAELLRELLARMARDDQGCAYAHGAFEYNWRIGEGQAHRVHVRRPLGSGDGGAAWQTVLDENLLAGGRAMCDVGAWAPSPGAHDVLAYSVDYSGSETYQVRFVALGGAGAAFAGLADVLEGASAEVVWGPLPALHVYYLALDEAQRPWRVMRHTPGTPQSADVCLLEEEDERFWLGMEPQRSGACLYLHSASKVTSEVWVVPWGAAAAGGAAAEPFCLCPRREGVLYSAAHCASSGSDGSDEGLHAILTNDGGAINNRLCTAPFRSVGSEAWVEVLPHSAALYLEGVYAFAGGVVALEGRAGGYAHVWLAQLPLAQGAAHGAAALRLVRVPKPQAIGCMSLSGGNREYGAGGVRVSYSDPTCPRRTLLVEFGGALGEGGVEDSEAREGGWGGGEGGASAASFWLAPPSALRQLHAVAVPSFDASRYATARMHATAADGTRIPISIVHRAGAGVGSAGFSPGPLLLKGYGSYGHSYDATFSKEALSLCDRGVAVAIAHVRGGGEMGRSWYEREGKLLRKRNTFTDFVSAAEALCGAGWSAPGRIAISGASAGGLLMGVCLNTRPELWGAVLSSVGFVDVVHSVADPSVPLAVTEWEEWVRGGRRRPRGAFLALSKHLTPHAAHTNTHARTGEPQRGGGLRVHLLVQPHGERARWPHALPPHAAHGGAARQQGVLLGARQVLPAPARGGGRAGAHPAQDGHGRGALFVL